MRRVASVTDLALTCLLPGREMQQESIFKISKVEGEWWHRITQHAVGGRPGPLRLWPCPERHARPRPRTLLIVTKIIPCMVLASRVNATVATLSLPTRVQRWPDARHRFGWPPLSAKTRIQEVVVETTRQIGHGRGR